MPLAAGARLGPYEIVGLVGAGGMGEVYRAHDTRLNRTVAIKISTEYLPDRFQREAHAIAALNHPNICQIYDIGDNYLVMEFVDGAPIGLVNDPPALLDLALQITDALVAAHEAGVIHRDLKPANILLTPRGQIKLLDFGLARHDHLAANEGARTTVATLTSPGATMGTLAYMSPEQARGETTDARTDLWSLGVVLHEVATGERPFDGPTAVMTIDAILNSTPVPVRERNPKIPDEFDRIVSRLLEKDRETRYQSAADLRADLRRVGRNSDRRLTAAARTGRRRSPTLAAALIGLAIVAALATIWRLTRERSPVTSATEYVQITDFTDSAVAPSLSPDGRMVTFIRGGEWFLSEGQIYVKFLPDGESRRLTNRTERKYAPVFTPDGSRVAFTVVASSGLGSWDTWTVPVLGGEPSRLLPNASALTWVSDHRVLFSEIESGLHMGVVSALENRVDEHKIYFPAHERAMAHFSSVSPDRRSVLIVEMDRTQTWQRCRLVPIDGSTGGVPVGPEGACTAAGWSPDGRWMYFGARVNGQSHLWRQSAGSRSAEQITFGPTEEEGIAVAPDGRSLVTSVGTRHSAIWFHDAAGDRQISPEGFAGLPWLSPDGRRVYYVLRQNPRSADFELCVTDLRSGSTEHVLPGFSVFDFDVSRDERQVAFTTHRDGESQVWLASLDRRTAPREIASPADRVSLLPDGDLLYRSLSTHVNYLNRIRQDGTGRETVMKEPILQKFSVPHDGQWAVVSVVGDGGDPITLAVPLRGGAPRTLCHGRCSPQWSWDGNVVYLTFGDTSAAMAVTEARQTFAIPLAPGQPIPDQPVDMSSPDNIIRVHPGATVITEQGTTLPGTERSSYVVAKADLRRNLFRIPLH